jgi:hypothetical protein
LVWNAVQALVEKPSKAVEKRYKTVFRCGLTTAFKGDSGGVYVSGSDHGTDEKGKETVAVEDTPLSPDEMSSSNVPVSSSKGDKAAGQSSQKDEIVSVERMV